MVKVTLALKNLAIQSLSLEGTAKGLAKLGNIVAILQGHMTIFQKSYMQRMEFRTVNCLHNQLHIEITAK